MCFFFSSRRRHTRSLCDWSSDVCSSDLPRPLRALYGLHAAPEGPRPSPRPASDLRVSGRSTTSRRSRGSPRTASSPSEAWEAQIECRNREAKEETERGKKEGMAKEWPGKTWRRSRGAAATRRRLSPIAAYRIDNVAVPDTPPVVAVMTVVPIASAVVSPFRSTLARSGCEETQVKVCPGTGFPLASCATAVNCCVSPTARDATAGLTTTDLTT